MNDKPRAEKQKEGLASRRLAVEVLMRVEAEGAFANLALTGAFKRKQLSERDRAFVTALVQGVLRHRSSIDEKISALANRRLEKMPAFMRSALRMAIFQLDGMPEIPQSAVVDTCVNLIRAVGHPGQVRFANAILRSYLRHRESGAKEGAQDKVQQTLSMQYSMPDWLVNKWVSRWGYDECRQLLEYSQKVPELVLRVCEESISTDGLLDIFHGKGIKARKGAIVPSCLIVEDRGAVRGPVSKLPGYDEGLFVVQDESAAFVSIVVTPVPGETVIDMCAAPGGKSLHLAEIMQNKGRVLAVDSHAQRLNLLRANRQRLGLTNIETQVSDALSLTVTQQADRVLLDAPCTGTGVLNKRSDIRYHRSPPDLVKLQQLQRALLVKAAELLKPGGVLVYATCSIEQEENEDNIQWFLNTDSQFRTESLLPFVPKGLQQLWQSSSPSTIQDLERGWITLLPTRHGTSGFFMARLRKTV